MILPPQKLHRRSCLAFTLPELQIAVGIMVFILAGTILSHITGQKICETIKGKLTNADQGRKTLGTIVNEIRTVYSVKVGAGGANWFTANVSNNLSGFPGYRAVTLYPSTNTNTFTRYYYDPADMTLKRITNGGSAKVLAQNLTDARFSIEDFKGAVLTNSPLPNNYVVGVNAYFRGPSNIVNYASTSGGTNRYVDQYWVSTRVTRRIRN